MAGVTIPGNAPQSPPVQLAPGWYWYQWPPEDDPIWQRVKRENASTLLVRREYVSIEDDWGMAVFLLRAPLKWRMRGTPARAPKGEATEWNDVLAPPVKPRSLVEHYVDNLEAFIEGSVVEPVDRALDKVGSAANFLLWGGVAVLLVNVWRTTSPR